MELFNDNVVPPQFLQDLVDLKKDQQNLNRTTNQILFNPTIIGAKVENPNISGGTIDDTPIPNPIPSDFLGLSDTPNSYSGQGDKYVKVNAGATALEFGAGGGGGGAIESATLVVAAVDSLDATRADYVCDGTNDETEIMAALTALPAGGGRVVLLEGTYTIHAPGIWLSDNQTLTGNGASTILKAVASAEYDFAIVQNYGSVLSEGGVPSVINSNIIISNMTIDGNKANNATFCTNPITVNCLLYGIIENCWIINGSGAGSTYTGDGIALGKFCDHIVIHNNFILNNDYDGIRCYPGISGGAGSVDVKIINNTVIGNDNGISVVCDFVNYADGHLISNNVCKNNISTGILIIGNRSQVAGHVLITNNNCIANDIGISVTEGASHCSIANNITNDSTQYGIFILGSLNLISANMVTTNGKHGIYVSWTETPEKISYENSIIGNQIYDNGASAYLYSGIFLEGVNSINVQLNKISGNNHVYGIDVDPTTGFAFITNNDLIYSGGDGDINNLGYDTTTAAGNRLTP